VIVIGLIWAGSRKISELERKIETEQTKVKECEKKIEELFRQHNLNIERLINRAEKG
jgi:cell division protein FtsL